MPSLVSLKTRLSSVTSTQKVIKAMELVASSKIKKAREKAQGVEYFQKTIVQSINKLENHIDYNNLIKENMNGVDLYIVITSDMGLAGPYNTNILNRYFKEIKKSNNFKTIVLGSKGVKKIEYEKQEVYKKYVGYGNTDEVELAKEITDDIILGLDEHRYKSIQIIYTDWINPIKQEVECLDILDASHWDQDVEVKPLEISPSKQEVFKVLFSQYVLALIYTTLLKSLASEHSYRRMSMDAANTNSLELIGKLELELNRARQSMITQEITEIIGGSESSKKE